MYMISLQIIWMYLILWRGGFLVFNSSLYSSVLSLIRKKFKVCQYYQSGEVFTNTNVLLFFQRLMINIKD